MQTDINDLIEEHLLARYKGSKVYEVPNIDRRAIGSICRNIDGVGLVWYRSMRDRIALRDFIAYELPSSDRGRTPPISLPKIK